MDRIGPTQGRAAMLLGLVAMAAVGLWPFACMAAGGDLDPTFGQGGKVETGFGHNARPMDGVMQPDGKLVIVGTIDNFQIATQVFHIVRYRSDGSLDPSFGNGGSVVIAFTNFISSANAVAIQPDGKIVVVGDTQSADGNLHQFAIARLTPSGALDGGFGSGGKVTTDFFGPPPHPGGFRETADAVLLQPDGKILVGGMASSNPDLPASTALARYNTNGSLDPSFGIGGLVAVRAIGNVNALALLTNGHILALNGSERPAEFSPDGSLLPGVTPWPIASVAHTGTSLFQEDGYIPAAGAERGVSENDLDVRLRRFNPTGGSDPTFTSALFDFGAKDLLPDAPQALCVMPNSEIAVGGYSNASISIQVFGLALLKSDGSFDSDFGNGGKVTTEFTGRDQVLALVAQLDGKIIAIGQTFSSTSGLADFALARYLGPSPAGASEPRDAIPGNFVELLVNPVRFGAARMRFGLANIDRVRAAIYDVGGRSIVTLADHTFPAGEHILAWDGSDDAGRRMEDGVYFARFNYGGGFAATRSIIIVR